MSLSPQLIVTPKLPYPRLYDGGLKARASLTMVGGLTMYASNTLSDHFENDRLLVYQGNTWGNDLGDWLQHAAFRTRVYFDTAYWGEDRQVLIVFDVETNSGTQDIQIFVGGDLVREENIDGRENIAILYDIVSHATIYIRPKARNEKLYFYKASLFII